MNFRQQKLNLKRISRWKNKKSMIQIKVQIRFCQETQAIIMTKFLRIHQNCEFPKKKSICKQRTKDQKK